jgi:hypothetical protein
MDLERRSRFLNHLLARFAESLEDPAAPKPDLAARKRRVLTRTSWIAFSSLKLPGIATAISNSNGDHTIRLLMRFSGSFEHPILIGPRIPTGRTK